MSTNNPVRQHTVPKMLLKNFLLPESKSLFEIHRTTGKCFPTPTTNASVEKDFYTLEGKDGQKHYDIEKGLSKIEGINSPIIQKLIENGVNSVSEKERAFFSNFLAIQLHRTRTMKAFTKATYDKFRDPKETLGFMDEIKSELEQQFSKATIAELKAKLEDGERLKKDPNFFLKNCLTPPSPRLANAICQMHWRIEKSKNKDTYFVIGDAPLAIRKRGHPTDPYFVGIERDDLDVEFYFPLSYERILIGSWNKPKKTKIQVGKMRVTELNKIAIVTSSFSVFTPIKDEAMIALVNSLRDFSVTVPPMKISGK